MSETRGRRIKTPHDIETTAPVIGDLSYAPSLIGAGLLEHGLDDGDDIYVWANKTSQTDVSGKLRAGFTLAKMGDVEDRLKANGIPTTFYATDEAGNVCYGTDLILMRGSRQFQEQLIRRALADQTSLVQDATVSEMNHKIDDLLSTTNIKGKDRPRVYKEEDHGTKEAIAMKENAK